MVRAFSFFLSLYSLSSSSPLVHVETVEVNKIQLRHSLFSGNWWGPPIKRSRVVGFAGYTTGKCCVLCCAPIISYQPAAASPETKNFTPKQETNKTKLSSPVHTRTTHKFTKTKKRKRDYTSYCCCYFDLSTLRNSWF